MTKHSSESLQTLAQLIETVHRLRAPGGCPWDRAQTHQTLRPYLIEEAHEVLDVLDRIQSANDLKDESLRGAFREELGDLLMQVLLHSEIASEEGAFDIHDVAAALNEKLIRRHPHVFGETKVDSPDMALQSWERQKAKERESKASSSVLEGLPRGLPALQRATRVIEKVTRVGFQWKDMRGPLEKVDEELAELKTEVLALERLMKSESEDRAAEETALRRNLEGELGDLLFSLCNLASLSRVNPEDALRGTIMRFESRFRHVEEQLKKNGKSPEHSTLDEMDVYWNEAKALERDKK
jgi:MazG family protein